MTTTHETWPRGKAKISFSNTSGMQSRTRKLTDEQVREIRVRIANGECNKDIAPIYGVKPACISLIRRGVNWASV